MTPSGILSSDTLAARATTSASVSLSSEVETVAGENIAPGTAIGRFVVRACLGRGLLNQDYLVEDTQTAEHVTLCFVPELVAASGDEITNLILAEAKSAATVRHPHAVRLLRVGKFHDRIYFVTEYYSGRTAADHLRQHGPFSARRAAEIIMSVAEALAAAHAVKFVHRDVRPETILMSDDGTVRLLGLGLVAAVEELAQYRLGIPLASVHYASPELYQTGEADARSDVYSLGATLFGLLTAGTPYVADTSLQVLHKHCTAPLPDPRTGGPGQAVAVPDLPNDFVALLHEMLAKKPSDRPASTLAVAQRLSALLDTLSDKPPVANSLSASVADAVGGSGTVSVWGHATVPPTWPADARAAGQQTPGQYGSGTYAQTMPTPLGYGSGTYPSHVSNGVADFGSGSGVGLTPPRFANPLPTHNTTGRSMLSTSGAYKLSSGSSVRLTAIGTAVPPRSALSSPWLWAIPAAAMVIVAVTLVAMRWNSTRLDARQTASSKISPAGRDTAHGSPHVVSDGDPSATDTTAATDTTPNLHQRSSVAPWTPPASPQTSTTELLSQLGYEYNRLLTLLREAEATKDTTLIDQALTNLERFAEKHAASSDTNRQEFAADARREVATVRQARNPKPQSPKADAKSASRPKAVQTYKFATPLSQLAINQDGTRLIVLNNAGLILGMSVAEDGSVATKPNFSRTPHQDGCHALALAADGQTFATGGADTMVRIWNAATGAKLAEFESHEAPVRAVGFSGDGKYLASGDANGQLRIWDVAAGSEYQRLIADNPSRSAITTLDFAPDNRRLALARADGTLELWDVIDNRLIERPRGNPKPVISLAWSPDGKRLVGGGADIRFWDGQGQPESSLNFSGRVSYVGTNANLLLILGPPLSMILLDRSEPLDFSALAGGADKVVAWAVTARGGRIIAVVVDQQLRIVSLNPTE